MVGKMFFCLSVCLSVPNYLLNKKPDHPKKIVASTQNEYGVIFFGPIGVGPWDDPNRGDPAK